MDLIAIRTACVTFAAYVIDVLPDRRSNDRTTSTKPVVVIPQKCSKNIRGMTTSRPGLEEVNPVLLPDCIPHFDRPRDLDFHIRATRSPTKKHQMPFLVAGSASDAAWSVTSVTRTPTRRRSHNIVSSTRRMLMS